MMQGMKSRGRCLAITPVLVLMAMGSAIAAGPGNEAALGDGRVMKALYDVNVGKAQKLSLYLRVIEQTVEDLESRNLRPDFVVALRGAAVRLASTDGKVTDTSEHEALRQVQAQIAALHQRGVRFEACAIATDLFRVDNASLMPQVKPVGNTFVSLIGYQSQGYALVPIQ